MTGKLALTADFTTTQTTRKPKMPHQTLEPTETLPTLQGAMRGLLAADGRTQSAVANAMGISTTLMGELLRGQRSPSPAVLESFCAEVSAAGQFSAMLHMLNMQHRGDTVRQRYLDSLSPDSAEGVRRWQGIDAIEAVRAMMDAAELPAEAQR